MKKPHIGQSEAGGSAGNAEASIANAVHLADRINALHHEVEQYKTQMLLEARAAGKLLLEAKDTVKHGEWLDWLEANFEGSGRTARAYMRIAAHWEKIGFKMAEGSANISIAEALKLLRYGYSRTTYRDEGRV